MDLDETGHALTTEGGRLLWCCPVAADRMELSPQATVGLDVQDINGSAWWDENRALWRIGARRRISVASAVYRRDLLYVFSIELQPHSSGAIASRARCLAMPPVAEMWLALCGGSLSALEMAVNRGRSLQSLQLAVASPPHHRPPALH